jgi:hypothetical protein
MLGGLKASRNGGKRRSSGGGSADKFEIFHHTFDCAPLGFSVKDSSGYTGVSVGAIKNTTLPLKVDDIVVAVRNQNVSKFTRKDVVAKIKGCGFPLKITFKRVQEAPPPKKSRVEKSSSPENEEIKPKQAENAGKGTKPAKDQSANKSASKARTNAQIQARAERFDTDKRGDASVREKKHTTYYNPLPNSYAIQQRADKGTKTYSNYGGKNFEVTKTELDLTKVTNDRVQLNHLHCLFSSG